MTRVAAVAAFVRVEAVHIFVGFEHLGDGAEVVERAAARPGPLHRRPLEQVVGHAVTLLVGRRAEHIGRDRATARHDQRGDRRTLIFRQQQRRRVALAIEAQEVGIVLLAVDEDAVAVGGLAIEAIERIYVCRVGGLAHHDAFAPRQPDVVAPLLVHARQQRIFVGRNIEHPRAARMGGVGVAGEALIGEGFEPGSVAIGYTRLNLEHERARLRRLLAGGGHEGGQRGRSGIGDDGAAWRVEYGRRSSGACSTITSIAPTSAPFSSAPRRSAALPRWLPNSAHSHVWVMLPVGQPRQTHSTVRGR